MKFRKGLLLAVAVLALNGADAGAEIVIGATVATTGPGAALGVLQKNAYELLPTSVAGETIRYVILDDGGDARVAVQNTKKLIEEYKADALLGSAAVPVALATAAIAEQAKTLQISLAPLPTRPFVFSATLGNDLMVGGVVEHMKKAGAKTVAFIGYSDALGDDLFKYLTQHAKANQIEIVTAERFGRTDTSVAGQVLKIVAGKPDAVFVGASGTPAILPHAALRERGFTGSIYHTHATAIREFTRVGGAKVEGAIMPTGPITVARTLPDTHPIKAGALDFTAKYEARHGAGSASFIAGVAWDGGNWIVKAIPEALKKGKPGTEAFRVALRDAIQSLKDVAGATTIATLSADDHTGLDRRSRVLVRVVGGQFVLVPE